MYNCLRFECEAETRDSNVKTFFYFTFLNVAKHGLGVWLQEQEKFDISYEFHVWSMRFGLEVDQKKSGCGYKIL